MSLQNSPILAPGSTMALSSPVMNYQAPQVDYMLKSADKPVYIYQQQFANNVGTTVTLNATSTSQAIWNISGDSVYNWGRSYLTFQLNAVASTNAGSLSVDTIPIDNITLQTVSGTQLAQLFNVQPYSRVVPALTTDLQDYLTRGPVWAAATVSGSRYTENKCLNPHDQLYSKAALTSTVGESTAAYVFGNTASPSVPYGSVLNNTSAVSGATKNYIGRQRMVYNGTAGNAAITGLAMQTLYNIPFKSFVGTMLAVDRDMLIGQNLQLIINFSATNQFIWDTAGDAANPSIIPAAAQTIITYVGAVTLANVYLWLAKEVQGSIVGKLRDMLRTGYEVMIPFTYCGKNSTSSTGLYSAPQTLSVGMGESLKRVINIIANGTATTGLINDINNVNGNKYTTIQSFLDANPLQYTQLQCGTDVQDYQYQAKFIKETVAGMSVREYQINSFFMDNFSSSLENGSKILENDVIDDGLKLSDASKNYNLQVTLAAGGSGANIFQYVTWLRRLVVAPNGLYWG